MKKILPGIAAVMVAALACPPNNAGVVHKGVEGTKKGVKAGVDGTKKGVKAGVDGTKKGVSWTVNGTKKGLKKMHL